MTLLFPLIESSPSSLPLYLVFDASLPSQLERLSDKQRAWVKACRFAAEAQAVCALPAADGSLAGYLVASTHEVEGDVWSLAGPARSLPAGDYHLAQPPATPEIANRLALGWALGAYEFEHYKARKSVMARLVWPDGADRLWVESQIRAIWHGRDLINRPANDLLPGDLAAEASAVAARFGAQCQIISGEDLTRQFPAIERVGRASAEAPRLIDIRWGDAADPKVTLVGKGVCFDSGGLNLKPSSAMRLMKKDMAGAATVLSIAQMVMAGSLPVRLRVLIPAVENAVSGSAYRPGDIVTTRKGMRVEVGDTDAEGRLIVCDALALGDEERPDLLIDCTTLTGAARVALGPEIPAFFCRQDDLAADFERVSAQTQDPTWRLPLWTGYRKLLDSKIAEISSTGEGSFAGAIIAALFLAEFVSPTTRWIHLDLMGWNNRSRPGRPEGGEVQMVRALYELIRQQSAADASRAERG